MAKKKLYLKIVNNQSLKIGDYLILFEDWLKRTMNIELELDVDITEYKNLPIKGIKKGKNTFIMLKDIKQKLRQDKVIPFKSYHGVIFIYSLKHAKKPKKNWRTSSWTYVNPYTPNGLDPFVEICWEQSQTKKEKLYNTLTHEIIHIFTRRARYLGLNIKDDMDLYDLDNDVESSTLRGNRGRNIARILPYLDKILTEPYRVSLMKTTMQLLKANVLLLRRLVSLNKKKLLITLMARAIQKHEGYFVGSRSYRNNNPANFRYTPYVASLGAIGFDEEGFAIFRNYKEGYKALKRFLSDALDNKLKYYKNTMNLIEFFSVYAPESDNNDPVNYAYSVSKQIAFPPDKPLRKFYDVG